MIGVICICVVWNFQYTVVPVTCMQNTVVNGTKPLRIHLASGVKDFLTLFIWLFTYVPYRIISS